MENMQNRIDDYIKELKGKNLELPVTFILCNKNNNVFQSGSADSIVNLKYDFDEEDYWETSPTARDLVKKQFTQGDYLYVGLFDGNKIIAEIWDDNNKII